MFIKKGITSTSGYTIDKKTFVQPQVLINSYLNNYASKIVSNFSHDMSRPIGYAEMEPLYFKNGIVYQTARIHFCEQDEDYLEVAKININHNNLLLDEYRNEFIKFEGKIKNHLSNDYKKFVLSSAAIYDKNIVTKIFPELSGDDKHKLIDIRMLKKEKYNNYSYKGFIIYPHQFFRRSQFLFNAINDEFFTVLNELYDNKELDIKIAIDVNLIGILGTEQKDMEFQFWWGPKFNNSLEKIDSGVTVHITDDRSKLFNRIERSEFFWYKQDDKKTFEIEEIVNYTIREDDILYYPSRFVHSMLDENNTPVHIDGAIRAYNEEKQVNRIDLSIDKVNRDTKYTKIWRVDGKITVIKWKELISHYYKDNRLIGEYFGGSDDIVYQEAASKEEKKPDVDYRLKLGIRFAFKTTDSIPDHNDFDYAVAFDNTSRLPKGLILKNQRLYENAMEKLKQYGRIVPSTTDDYVNSIFKNTPLFICVNQEIIINVIKSIQESLSESNEKVSFAIGLLLEEKVFLMSFLGEESELSEFINKMKFSSNDFSKLEQLLVKINETINNNPKEIDESPFDLMY